MTLVLNGLTLTSSDTAPISCNKSSGVTIVAASGTTNTLTDSAYNNDDNYPDNGNAENAVIKCKDGSQVTICGAGTINIAANGKNGIKSGATTDEEGEAWMQIQDVTLNITASVNDGINAEQLLTIASGTITVNAADDGIHSDYILNVGAEGTTGPTISIGSSYEGLEAATLNIDSGNLTIQSTDDCLNAANSDLSDYSFSLNIAGGTLYMYSSTGDGIDSNGTLTISGGTTQVWTANAADNQPLDADGVISITGGVVLAAGGSAGQGMNLSAGQPYVIFGSSTMGGQFGGQSSVSVSSGSTFTIMDSSGNTVYSGTAGCNASYVVFSSASLTSGETYTLYSGGTGIASASAQLAADGNGNTDGQPSAPGNGEQPSEPGNGEQPSEPGNGEQPSAPENGEQPSAPGNVEQPSAPENGGQPSAPGNGEQPSAPGNGEQPSEPGNGEQPSVPAEPSIPAEPSESPEQPSTPAEPSESLEQPSVPTKQSESSQEQTETQKKRQRMGLPLLKIRNFLPQMTPMEQQ